jgi:hypothetical protein
LFPRKKGRTDLHAGFEARLLAATNFSGHHGGTEPGLLDLNFVIAEFKLLDCEMSVGVGCDCSSRTRATTDRDFRVRHYCARLIANCTLHVSCQRGKNRHGKEKNQQ